MHRIILNIGTACILFGPLQSSVASTSTQSRARDLGIPFDGTPGTFNAITDVRGVEVGYVTLISDEGDVRVGKGLVRTGVTAILPRGKRSKDPVFAGWFSLNGNGEMTGTTWVEESGFLEGPVLISNTHSVGIVRDAAIAWSIKHDTLFQSIALPVVAETSDAYLNDMNGFHVKQGHVFEALDTATNGPIAEGNVGGGTGMICYEFKGGTGTASRILTSQDTHYTVGVLVQANHGRRFQLQVAGVPVGRELVENAPFTRGADLYNERGSIIVVVATDAPLLPHQLKRMAKRAALGLARTGSASGNGSGDIFIAFSTANPEVAATPGPAKVRMLSNDEMDPLFGAVTLSTEEAIINALVAAETMKGIDGHKIYSLPHDRLKAVMKKYNR